MGAGASRDGASEVEDAAPTRRIATPAVAVFAVHSLHWACLTCPTHRPDKLCPTGPASQPAGQWSQHWKSGQLAGTWW